MDKFCFAIFYFVLSILLIHARLESIRPAVAKIEWMIIDTYPTLVVCRMPRAYSVNLEHQIVWSTIYNGLPIEVAQTFLVSEKMAKRAVQPYFAKGDLLSKHSCCRPRSFKCEQSGYLFAVAPGQPRNIYSGGPRNVCRNNWDIFAPNVDYLLCQSLWFNTAENVVNINVAFRYQWSRVYDAGGSHGLHSLSG